MNLKPIFPYLNDRRAAMVINAVVDLEAAIAAGMVPNKLFVDAKDTINRAIGEADKPFFDVTGLWSRAYDADALLDGAHTLPTKLKRAQKAGLTDYVTFIADLMPLRDLLEAAKPLIRKKGDMPKVMTPAQQADDAKRMTCQCCARRIFAETGSIAHHGYERPGGGYQTSSCMGAKALPFEVDRKVLGVMIDVLRKRHEEMVQRRESIAAERLAITRRWEAGRKPSVVRHQFEFTRATFGTEEGLAARRAIGFYGDFQTMLERDLERRAHGIKMIYDDITAHQARYDGWKQTHEWKAGQWEKI